MGTHEGSSNQPAQFFVYHFVLAATLAWSATSANAYAQASHPPSEGLVRQIDHIIISSDDPEKMMRLLSESSLCQLHGRSKHTERFRVGALVLATSISKWVGYPRGAA